MDDFTNFFQKADWKKEKHVPVIDAPDTIKAGESFKFAVSVGKEIPHPNTTEHHIRWIEVYFLPDNEKFPYQIAKFDFSAHGESLQGPNTGTVFTAPEVTLSMKSNKSGQIFAASFCNIHGLWQNSKNLKIQ